MKKLVSRFLILALVLGGLFMFPPQTEAQGAPAAYTNAAADVQTYLTISSSPFRDTLAGVDSFTVFSGQEFAPGYDYILDRDAFTGSPTDSVKVRLRLVNSSIASSGTWQVTEVDSFLQTAGEQVILPINRTLYGKRFSLKLISFTGNGGKVIVNKMCIWKRRAQSTGY